MSLHGAARQPHAELYMGLVEVGVGLLPGGGGCKEMLLRAIDSASTIRPGGRGESVELMEAMKRTFEAIAMAKVSTSAQEARSIGLLSASDSITMNRDRAVTDAKNRALDFCGQAMSRRSLEWIFLHPARIFLRRSSLAFTSCGRANTSRNTK